MNCETARMLLTFFGRHGAELAPEDTTALESHLTACPSCAALQQQERAFDDRIAGVMRHVPVPLHLKTKIHDSLASQRGAWYRSRAVALAGVAGVLMFGFGGYIAYQIQTAPKLAAEQLLIQEDRQVEDPASRIDWVLSRHGLRFSPQRTFDLNQLATVGTAELQGQEVPMLYFRNVRKNSHAKVYVVDDRMFNWKALDPADVNFQSKYGHQVVVLADATRSNVGYIVIYTGDTLDVFLESTTSN